MAECLALSRSGLMAYDTTPAGSGARGWGTASDDDAVERCVRCGGCWWRPTGEVMIGRCSRSQVSSEWGESVSRARELIRAEAGWRRRAVRTGSTAGAGAVIRVRRWMARSGRARDLEEAAPTGTHAPVYNLSARRGVGRVVARALGGCGVVSWPPALQTCVRTQPPHGAVGARLELHAASACSRQGSRFCSRDARGTSNNAVTGFREKKMPLLYSVAESS